MIRGDIHYDAHIAVIEAKPGANNPPLAVSSTATSTVGSFRTTVRRPVPCYRRGDLLIADICAIGRCESDVFPLVFKCGRSFVLSSFYRLSR